MAKKAALVDPHRMVVAGTRGHGLRRAGESALLTAGFGASALAQVSLWRIADGTALGQLGTGTGVVCWLAAQSSAGLVAAGFGDLTLRLWDPRTDVSRTLGTLEGIVASLAWAGDGALLFTGNCGDNTVRLWDVASGLVVAEGKTRKSATWFVAMSADAELGVSGSGDKGVHVWEPKKGREIATLEGHTGTILWLDFFPDGRRVVSASQDRSVRIWDVAARRPIHVLGGHTKQVTCAVVSPDGAQIASASSDGTIRLWNAATGSAERVISIGGTGATGIDYSTDGRELFALCGDGVRGFAVGAPEPAVHRNLDALYAAVWAAPEDDGPRAVLADALLEQGDPRGELITLQLARAGGSSTVESRQRERELLQRHRAEWVGPIAPLVLATHLTFERGFVVGCRLKPLVEKGSPVRHPAWATVKQFVASEGSPGSLIRHLVALGATRREP